MDDVDGFYKQLAKALFPFIHYGNTIKAFERPDFETVVYDISTGATLTMQNLKQLMEIIGHDDLNKKIQD
jgi:hypothetical protein